MSIALHPVAPEAKVTGLPNIDVSPYMMPGVDGRTLAIASRLAGLWKQNLQYTELVESGGPNALPRRPLNHFETEIVLLNNLNRRYGIGNNVVATDDAHTDLITSTRYREANAAAKQSVDRVIVNNFGAYKLDRLAFLAAWYTIHPNPDSVQ